MRTAESVVFTLWPPGPGAIHVYLEILVIDLDLDVFCFRKHGDGHRRCVDSSLTLGLGNALHPVDAGFVLHAAEDALAFDERDDFLEAAALGQAL